jgi:predicted nucleotidyltransferase
MNNIEASKNSRKISSEEIHAIARQIAQKFNPNKIILFGSYARGNYHAFSDVDLLVVLEKNQNGVDPEIEVALSVPHKFPMDILVRSPQEVSQRLQMGDSFLRDIMERGVILYERFSE